jgi:hypothetical protein
MTTKSVQVYRDDLGIGGKIIMMLLPLALTCVCLFLIGCKDLNKTSSDVENNDSISTQKSTSSKQIYRCDYSPIIDPSAKDFAESLTNSTWRVVSDGVCNDVETHENLVKAVTNLPNFTEQDYPFVGYCEHYLLTDGSTKALLIGFVCENYGIVVWEMEADESGRWMKTESGTRRGTEEDKTLIRSILSKAKFNSL